MEHEPINWFKFGKALCPAYILSPSLFNLYAEYTMQNAGMAQSQAGIKTVRSYQQPQKCR